jgi:hypothetical protein
MAHHCTKENAKPVTISNDCRIGDGAIIVPVLVLAIIVLFHPTFLCECIVMTLVTISCFGCTFSIPAISYKRANDIFVLAVSILL